MAAETLTATRAASTFPVYKGKGAGDLCVAWGTYELAANVEDGDIFEMCRIPKGAVVVGGAVYADDLDTDASEALDMDVGWAANGVDDADVDGFGNLGTWTGDAVAGVKPETGINFPFGGKLLTHGPQTFNAETVIQIEAHAAATAGGTGTLSVVVYYVTP